MRTSSTPIIPALLSMARTWAKARSKDPNTQVGAVVYNVSTGEMFFGYNGFARGVKDLPSRWEKPYKYDYVIHAEENAVLKMLAAVGTIDKNNNYIMVCTHKPCCRCISRIIQAGIKSVFYDLPHDDATLTNDIANDVGIVLRRIDIDVEKLYP